MDRRGRQTRIVGRTGELQVLTHLLESVPEAPSRIVFVEGEAGIGKTRLIDEAIARFDDRFTVCRGRAHELEGDRPFGALLDALDVDEQSPDSDRAAVAALVHSGEWTPTGENTGLPYRILDRMLTLLERDATREPVALILDDLHWADEFTVLATYYLGRRLTHLPVVIIVMSRPAPSNHLAKVIDRIDELGAVHIPLGPLSDDAVETLALDLLAARPGPQLQEQLATARGNPFFIIELISALQREGAIHKSPHLAEVPNAHVPPVVRDVILRRFDYLSQPAHALLRTASLLGPTFSLVDLALAVGRPAIELAPFVDEAIAGRLLDAGDRISFRHELVRRCIYEHMPEPVRKALHLEIGHRFADAEAEPRKVAAHLSLGAPPGDDTAVRWLELAAARVFDAFPTVAAELLERALAIAGTPHPRRRALTFDCIQALNWAGRPSEAEELARRTLALKPSPGEAVVVETALARSLLLQGRWSEGAAAYENIAASLPRSDPSRATAVAEATLASVFGVNFDHAHGLALEAIALGREHADALAVCLANCALSALEVFVGNLDEAVRRSREAVDVAMTADNSQPRRRSPHFFHGICLIEADRLDEAEQTLHEGRRVCEELGTVWNLPLFNFAIAGIPFWKGEWEQAVVELETGFTLAHDTDTRWGIVLLKSVLAYIAIHRNMIDVATAHLEEADRELASSGTQFGTEWLMWTRALLLETTGAHEQAYTLLKGAWDMATQMGIVNYHRLIGPDLAQMAARAEDTLQLDEIVQSSELMAQRMQTSSARGSAQWVRAIADDDPSIFLDAVATYRASPRRVEYARLCEDAGGCLARAGELEQARALFDEALFVYERAEAVRNTQRTLATMRSFGIRRGRRGRLRSQKTGWESLTDAELRVVRMVAEGLSNPAIGNRLFVSRRTVESHVGSALAKLGISSRVELATMAATRAESHTAK